MALAPQFYRTLQLSHPETLCQHFVFHAKTNYYTPTYNTQMLNYKSLVNLLRGQSPTNVSTLQQSIGYRIARHITSLSSLSWLGL